MLLMPHDCQISIEELHTALHRHLKVDRRFDESQIARMERLFSPRDFLFTNAAQVKKIVEMRQCALLEEKAGVH